MPLDVLLHHMREMHEEAVRLAEIATEAEPFTARIVACRNAALQAAKDAAPYVHAKLTATEITGKDGGAVQIAADMSDHELARRVAILLAPKPLALKDIPASLPAPDPVDVVHSVVDNAQMDDRSSEKPSDNSVLQPVSTT